MKKKKDGLEKPSVMIDCWDGSYTVLRDDGDLGVVMEILIKRWWDDGWSNDGGVDGGWKKMMIN